MAQIYKFFNAVEIEPGVYDREYQASDFADFFGSILSSGLIHTEEIPGMQVYVEPGTLRTYITPGKAVIKGQLYENTANEYLEHSLPESTMDRIDRIVLRLDLRNSVRNILLHVKEGSPSDNPVAPELQRDNFIYELSLAQIRVRANTSSLAESDLVDERLVENLCGLVNSMLTVPTSQFLAEWQTWFNDIQQQSPASQGDLEDLESTVNAHLAESVYDEEGVHGLAIERGIWTPQIAGATAYETQKGYYEKIGKMIFIDAYIALANKGTDSSEIFIEGLPFVTNQGDSTQQRRASVIFSTASKVTLPSGGFNISGYCRPGESRIHVFAIGSVALTKANIASDSMFRFSGAYAIS